MNANFPSPEIANCSGSDPTCHRSASFRATGSITPRPSAVFVRRRALGIHARRHARGAAQRDQDAPAIRRRVNSAWSLAYPESYNNSIRRTVNDTYIPGSFVANIHEIIRGFSRSGQRYTNSCSTANRQTAESHILAATSYRLSEQVRSRCRSSKLDVRCSLLDVWFNAKP